MNVSNSADVEYVVISGGGFRKVIIVCFCAEHQKCPSEPNQPDPPRVGVYG